MLLARLLELRTYAAVADALASIFERSRAARAPPARPRRRLVVARPGPARRASRAADLAAAYLRGIEDRPVPVVRLDHVTVDTVTVAETRGRAGRAPAGDGHAVVRAS